MKRKWVNQLFCIDTLLLSLASQKFQNVLTLSWFLILIAGVFLDSSINSTLIYLKGSTDLPFTILYYTRYVNTSSFYHYRTESKLKILLWKKNLKGIGAEFHLYIIWSNPSMMMLLLQFPDCCKQNYRVKVSQKRERKRYELVSSFRVINWTIFAPII